MLTSDMTKRWSELRKLHAELTGKALQLLSHPEATDQMILDTAKLLVRNRAQLEAMRKSLLIIALKKRMYVMESYLKRGFD